MCTNSTTEKRSPRCQIVARNFACQHSEVTTYLSVDDKAIVPVGEPDLSSRSHNRSLVLTGASLKALDYDFHIHGIVPSVVFAVNIASDGGPDHRLTFYSVQISLLCFNLTSTCWWWCVSKLANIAERVMSTLNLGCRMWHCAERQ